MPSTFPNSPRIMRGGIVLLNPQSGSVQKVITLQINPESLNRTLQVQSLKEESGDREEALRLTGPPVENIKFEAEIDATDQLEFPDQNPVIVENGILPVLDTLETIIYPTSKEIEANNLLGLSGMLEIIPMEAPLTLFVWNSNRIVPVRITEFSITEEFFDTQLNPIRAKVSLGMRVLNINDLGVDHIGSNMFMIHHKLKEKISRLNPNASLSSALTNLLR